jgi:hypothetical protein
MSVSFSCTACGGRLHHSRLKTWYDRARWRTTGLVPWRCGKCGKRAWHRDAGTAMTIDEARDVRPQLTERELDGLDPDAEGEAT